MFVGLFVVVDDILSVVMKVLVKVVGVVIDDVVVIL